MYCSKSYIVISDIKLTQFSLLATIVKSSAISIWSVLFLTSLSFKTLQKKQIT